MISIGFNDCGSGSINQVNEYTVYTVYANHRSNFNGDFISLMDQIELKCEFRLPFKFIFRVFVSCHFLKSAQLFS